MHHHIIANARGFIGTRFHHQGRLKKTSAHAGGIDCLGLLVCIARELKIPSRAGGLVADVDELNYSHQPDTKKMHEILSTHLSTIPTGGISAGDIAIFIIDGSPQHMGIISDYAGAFGIIHAYAPARKVVEHALDDEWRNKLVCAYRVSN